MEMVWKKKSLGDVLPIMGVKDGYILSKRGEITLGWEITLPVMHSVTEEGYDDIVNSFHSAAKLLPQWTMIHRQDVFRYETFHGEYGGSFLSDRFNAHFEGRKYLTHHQYLFLTMTSKASVLKEYSRSSAFGVQFTAALPSVEDMKQFTRKADEFISVITGNEHIKARPLTQEELEGHGVQPGLIEKYLMLGDDTPLRSDIIIGPGEAQVYDKALIGFKISESEELPSEVSNVNRVDEFYANGVELFLSFGSAIGERLNCEHVVNQYIVMPSQGYVLQELDKKRKKSTSGASSSAENRVNAEQVTQFIDDVHKYSYQCCYTHMNILAWGDREEIRDIKGSISSALSSMGIVATQAIYDLPVLYLSGVPGGACELSKEELMVQELMSSLCMGINESFDKPVPDGTFQIIDRQRNIPIRIDIQKKARSLGYIDNYNVFLLGPSGSGKSFFTNFFLRQCYDNGEHVFIIDVGDSYEGLCSIINEESNGEDGVYLSWDINHPFSFNPFVGIYEWLDDDGSLRQDHSGVNFFISFLTTAWIPTGGWTSDGLAILETILVEFLHKERSLNREGLPIFDDFYQFLGQDILPRIMPVLDERGLVVRQPENPLIVAYNPVKPDDFDVVKFMRALVQYSASGSYAFLLNDRNPKDLFASRFTVFEVFKLSEGNPLFYSICVLCIMNAFDQKMQNAVGFKRIVVDEAWKAIANETMAPYLKGLWKTARKYQTSAMVVTQELDDIISSDVIKEAILQNSDTKILLNQAKNRNRFEQLSSIMGLGDHQKNMILSMGMGHRADLPFYTDCYIGMNNRYGIYSIESSKAEALAYESDKVKKKPLLDRAEELGSIRAAITEFSDKKQKKR